jgi:hypothetical protein
MYREICKRIYIIIYIYYILEKFSFFWIPFFSEELPGALLPHHPHISYIHILYFVLYPVTPCASASLCPLYTTLYHWAMCHLDPSSFTFLVVLVFFHARHPLHSDRCLAQIRKKYLTSGTAQVSGGSFTDRNPMGEVLLWRMHGRAIALKDRQVAEAISLSLYLSVCLSICLPISLTVYLDLSLSIALFLYRSLYPSPYLSSYLSVYLSAHLSMYLAATFLSVCLSACLSVCLSVFLSLCLSFYLPTFLSL